MRDSDHDGGLFSQPYAGPNGEEELIAVDSRGRCVARVFVTENGNRAGVVRAMRQLIHHLDPVPNLELLDGGED